MNIDSKESLKRMHRTMWHPTADVMCRHLRPILEKQPDKGKESKRRIEEVCRECEVCRSVVNRIPDQSRSFGIKATRPNEWVMMDSIQVDTAKGPHVGIHVVDVCTRWSMVTTWPGKVQQVTARRACEAMSSWCAVFGRMPTKVITDCGHEFVGKEFTDYMSRGGTISYYSPPYNQQSHGLVERHNGVWKVIFRRLEAEFAEELKAGLITIADVAQQASAAKNAMIRKNGYSSHFLAFGYNVWFGTELEEESIGQVDEDSAEAAAQAAEVRIQLRRKACEQAIAAHCRKESARIITSGSIGQAPLGQGQIVDMIVRNPHHNKGKPYWMSKCVVVGKEGDHKYYVRSPSGTVYAAHRRQIRPEVEHIRLRQISQEGKRGDEREHESPDVEQHGEQEIKALDHIPTQVVGELLEDEPEEIEENDYDHNISTKAREDGARRDSEPDSGTETLNGGNRNSETDPGTEIREEQHNLNGHSDQDTEFLTGEEGTPEHEMRAGVQGTDSDDTSIQGRQRSRRLRLIAETETAEKQRRTLHDLYSTENQPVTSVPPEKRAKRKHVMHVCGKGEFFLAQTGADGKLSGDDVDFIQERGDFMIEMNDTFLSAKGGQKWAARRRKEGNSLMQKGKTNAEMGKEEQVRFRRQVDAAKHKELEGFKETESYQEVPFVEEKHRNVMTGRWILTWKAVPEPERKRFEQDETFDPSGCRRAKARYVLRGFQDKELEHLKTDAPTVKTQSLFTTLAWAAANGLRVVNVDVAQAFLRGKELGEDRSIQVLPPQEARSPEGHIWELRKCVYGTADAPLRWYLALKDHMEQSGGTTTTLEPAVFAFKDKDGSDKQAAMITGDVCGDRVPHMKRTGNTKGVIPAHVDDMFICGTESFFEEEYKMIDKKLKFGSREEIGRADGTKFTGSFWVRDKAGIFVGQQRYIEEIDQIPIQGSVKDEELVGPKMQAAFRSALGAVGWATLRTRPDESYAYSRLSRISGKATGGSIRALNKLIRRMQTSAKTGIRLPRIDAKMTEMRIVGVSDASWNREENSKSQGGFMIFIAEDKNCNERPVRAALVRWRSWRLMRVAWSTLSAEAQALVVCNNHCVWLQKFVESTFGVRMPIDLRTDCKSLVDALSTCHSYDDVRMQVQIDAVKEDLQQGQCRSCKHVDGKLNYADILTKPADWRIAERVRQMMMTGEIDEMQ